MSSAVQRTSLRIGSPQIAPIGGPQFGAGGMLPQHDSSGGISPIGAPVAPVSPTPIGGGGGLLDGQIFDDGMGLNGGLNLPLTRLELGSIMRPRNMEYL